MCWSAVLFPSAHIVRDWGVCSLACLFVLAAQSARFRLVCGSANVHACTPSLCVRVCLHAHVYMCACVHVRVCVNACVRACVCTYVRTCVRMCVRVCACLFACVYASESESTSASASAST